MCGNFTRDARSANRGWNGADFSATSLGGETLDGDATTQKNMGNI